MNEHGRTLSDHPKRIPESGEGAGIPAIPQPSLPGSPRLQGRRLPAILCVRSKSPQQTAARAAGPIFKREQLSGVTKALGCRARPAAAAQCRGVQGFVPLTQQAFLSTACPSKQCSHTLRLETRCLEENCPMPHMWGPFLPRGCKPPERAILVKDHLL